jgi:hypothetical protein
VACGPTLGCHERPAPFYQGLTEALVDHAKATFHLNQKQNDGKILREHLQAVEKRTGRCPPELDLPELPDECRGVWGLFVEINNLRSEGFGPAIIDEARLCHWQQLHGIRLNPWEIEAIFAIDRAWREGLAQSRDVAC